jgi:lipopolysaccharide export system protein LptC
MNSRLSHALPVILMLLLGGLSLWLRQVIEGPGAAPAAQRSHDPDSVVEKFTVTRLGPGGLPEAVLSAGRMVHYADDDSIELHAPQLLKNEPGSGLSVRADRGTVTRDYEEAHFYDNVQLLRRDESSPDPMQVRTQYLHVLINRDLLRTDRRVTITQGTSQLAGTGLEYDRRSGRLSLLSDVKASFDARRR